MTRIFLFHWNTEEAARNAAVLEEKGFAVDSESEAGEIGCKKIAASPPAAVVLTLDRLPSHSIHTAAFLQTQKQTAEIPLVFYGGSPESHEKARLKVPGATLVSWEELPDALSHLLSAIV